MRSPTIYTLCRAVKLIEKGLFPALRHFAIYQLKSPKTNKKKPRKRQTQFITHTKGFSAATTLTFARARRASSLPRGFVVRRWVRIDGKSSRVLKKAYQRGQRAERERGLKSRGVACTMNRSMDSYTSASPPPDNNDDGDIYIHVPLVFN